MKKKYIDAMVAGWKAGITGTTVTQNPYKSGTSQFILFRVIWYAAREALIHNFPVCLEMVDDLTSHMRGDDLKTAKPKKKIVCGESGRL